MHATISLATVFLLTIIVIECKGGRGGSVKGGISRGNTGRSTTFSGGGRGSSIGKTFRGTSGFSKSQMSSGLIGAFAGYQFGRMASCPVGICMYGRIYNYRPHQHRSGYRDCSYGLDTDITTAITVNGTDYNIDTIYFQCSATETCCDLDCCTESVEVWVWVVSGLAIIGIILCMCCGVAVLCCRRYRTRQRNSANSQLYKPEHVTSCANNWSYASVAAATPPAYNGMTPLPVNNIPSSSYPQQQDLPQGAIYNPYADAPPPYNPYKPPPAYSPPPVHANASVPAANDAWNPQSSAKLAAHR